MSSGGKNSPPGNIGAKFVDDPVIERLVVYGDARPYLVAAVWVRPEAPAAAVAVPTGPIGPDGPVAPVGPVGPEGPVTPREPGGPLGPDGPVGPMGPVAPPVLAGLPRLVR